MGEEAATEVDTPEEKKINILIYSVSLEFLVGFVRN